MDAAAENDNKDDYNDDGGAGEQQIKENGNEEHVMLTTMKRMIPLMQERLRQQAIKDAEKERAQFYAKQKEGQKDVRAKYREKVRAVWFGLGKNREGPNHSV